jgi:hypothetical protein
MKKWLAKNQQASANRKSKRRQWLRKQWNQEKEKDPNLALHTISEAGTTMKGIKALKVTWWRF